jgi:hypothetical protein
MKKAKFLFALVLGSLLGLLASCKATAPQTKQPVPPGNPATGAPTNTVPEKQDELPVRGPILE